MGYRVIPIPQSRHFFSMPRFASGQGHFTWVDGRSYEGAYNNDQKDGFGTSGARPGGLRKAGPRRSGKPTETMENPHF